MMTLAALLTGSSALAYEQPDYVVLQKANDYEIRRYQPFIVAEVDVGGDFDDSGSAAFRILADYLFGENLPADAVDSDVRGSKRGQRMAMTAPVISMESDSGDAGSTYTYAFVMPSQFTLATLPKPLDERIRIREVPGRIMAAHRYSGRWTESRFEAHESALLGSLQWDGIEPEGQTLLARYNAPWTPWFMRRNEILIPVSAAVR